MAGLSNSASSLSPPPPPLRRGTVSLRLPRISCDVRAGNKGRDRTRTGRDQRYPLTGDLRLPALTAGAGDLQIVR